MFINICQYLTNIMCIMVEGLAEVLGRRITEDEWSLFRPHLLAIYP